MAKSVTLWGATYSNVPAIEVPSGNSIAKFIEPSPTTASVSDVASGKIFFDSQGNQQTGTASGGSVPYPTFNVTWSNDWSSIVSVTCDKTHQYCYDLYNNDNDARGVTIEHNQAQTETQALDASVDSISANDDIKYVIVAGATPYYDLIYHPNGTISAVYPSSRNITLTPTATKGTVSTHSITVTPSVTVSSWGGFVSGGTTTGTPVTVTARELVSGNLAISQNGNNIDVTNYASVSVNVSGGSNTFTLEYQNEHGLWSFTPTYADIKEAVQQNKVINYTSFGDPALGGKEGSGYATNVTFNGTTFTEAVRFYLQDFTFDGVSLVYYGYSNGELRTQSNLVYFEPQGNLNITTNGTHNVTNYATVSVNVSGGTSKNVQVHQSTTRATSSTYTSVNSFTCTKSAKYTVYWSTMRSSTSGTSGSQLYIGGTAYGTADTANWSNHVQNKKVTGVQINANQTVAVYARSRGSNYYSYAPLVTIIEE